MPTPVAKLLAILVLKRLRDDELTAGYTFEMPEEVLDAYHVTDAEWRQAWLKSDWNAPYPFSRRLFTLAPSSCTIS
jgi:hypothetical protein